MASLSELVGRVVFAGGLLTAGGAFVDGIQSGAFQRQAQAIVEDGEYIQALREVYDIKYVCAPDFGGGVQCYDSLQPEEQYAQYVSALNQRPEVPIDPRAVVDAIGVVGGLLIVNKRVQGE